VRVYLVVRRRGRVDPHSLWLLLLRRLRELCEYIYIYIYVCVCVIYIYIPVVVVPYRESCVSIYLYMYVYVYVLYIYIPVVAVVAIPSFESSRESQRKDYSSGVVERS